jgi:hypothetical protein
LRLAGVAGVSTSVITNFERKGYLASVLNLYRLRMAFEEGGVEFPEEGPPRLFRDRVKPSGLGPGQKKDAGPGLDLGRR